MKITFNNTVSLLALENGDPVFLINIRNFILSKYVSFVIIIIINNYY